MRRLVRLFDRVDRRLRPPRGAAAGGYVEYANPGLVAWGWGYLDQELVTTRSYRVAKAYLDTVYCEIALGDLPCSNS